MTARTITVRFPTPDPKDNGHEWAQEVWEAPRRVSKLGKRVCRRCGKSPMDLHETTSSLLDFDPCDGRKIDP